MNILEAIKNFFISLLNAIFKMKLPSPDNTSGDTPGTPSENDTPGTDTPSTKDFPVMYYINPEEEVNGVVDVDKYLEDLDFSFFPKIGVTDLLVRTTSTGYSTDGTRAVGIKYTKLPEWKKKCDEYGLRLHAWVWNKFPYTKQVSDMNVHTHIDLETYDLSSEHPQVEQLRADSEGYIFGVCTKPDGWDADQSPEMLYPHVDYIAPMLYLGDYNQSIDNLVAKVKEYQRRCPGKIIPVLETYQSDNNTVAKSESGLLAEIEAVMPYCQGVALFRYDRAGRLSKFNGLSTTSTTTNTTTTNFSPDSDGCYNSPRYLSDEHMKQDTGVWCALNAIQQVIYELTGIIIEESEIYDLNYTGSEGTAPSGLIEELKTQARKLNINIKVESFSFSQIGWDGIGQAVADPKKAVFFHELYMDQWGHYDYPVSVCPSNIYMANSLQSQVIGYPRSTLRSWFNGISGNSIYIVKLED